MFFMYFLHLKLQFPYLFCHHSLDFKGKSAVDRLKDLNETIPQAYSGKPFDKPNTNHLLQLERVGQITLHHTCRTVQVIKTCQQKQAGAKNSISTVHPKKKEKSPAATSM